MYHRVADPPLDPWGLCVAPDRFRDQLVALKAHRVVISLDELVDALEAGAVPPRATALTFDDGYSDNASTAKPLLEELGVPATMFLTTGSLGKDRPFWWDELATLVLAGRRAADFDFEVAGVRLAARWDAQDSLPRDLKDWRTQAGTNAPRRVAYATPRRAGARWPTTWPASPPLQQRRRQVRRAALRRGYDPAPG